MGVDKGGLDQALMIAERPSFAVWSAQTSIESPSTWVYKKGRLMGRGPIRRCETDHGFAEREVCAQQAAPSPFRRMLDTAGNCTQNGQERKLTVPDQQMPIADQVTGIWGNLRLLSSYSMYR